MITIITDRERELQAQVDRLLESNHRLGESWERAQAQVDALKEALKASSALITVVRMPNIEHIADAHNAAVAKMRAAMKDTHE